MYIQQNCFTCFWENTVQSMTIDQSGVEKCAHWLVNARNTKVIPKIFCSYFFDTFGISLEVLILVFQHSILNHQNRFKRLPSFLIFFLRSLDSIDNIIGNIICVKNRVATNNSICNFWMIFKYPNSCYRISLYENLPSYQIPNSCRIFIKQNVYKKYRKKLHIATKTKNQILLFSCCLKFNLWKKY